MLTLAVENVDSLLTLWFALLALRIARVEPAHARASQRSAWWLAGSCFLLLGISSVLQSMAATWAFIQGPGSPAWNTYVYWFSVGNHGRGGLVVALAAMLVLNAHPAAEEGWLRRVAWGAYAAALLLGSALGWGERGQVALHYADTAVLNAVETVAMLVALALALPTHSMGRWLWIALAFYTLTLVQNVSWFSVLAEAAESRGWKPHAGLMNSFSTTTSLLMLALAAWKLRLARLGRISYALLESPERR